MTALALGHLRRRPRPVGEVISDAEHGDRVQDLDPDHAQDRVHEIRGIRRGVAGCFASALRRICHGSKCTLPVSVSCLLLKSP